MCVYVYVYVCVCVCRMCVCLCMCVCVCVCMDKANMTVEENTVLYGLSNRMECLS